jgi:hypothetical protein
MSISKIILIYIVIIKTTIQKKYPCAHLYHWYLCFTLLRRSLSLVLIMNIFWQLSVVFIFFNELWAVLMGHYIFLPKYLRLQRMLLDTTQGRSLSVSGCAHGVWPCRGLCINHDVEGGPQTSLGHSWDSLLLGRWSNQPRRHCWEGKVGARKGC